MKYFINLSNHPSNKWDKKQYDAANAYGTVIDLPFPSVPATADEENIQSLVEEYIKTIQKYDNPVVMCQGEFTFSFMMINKLIDMGIKVVASCTERNTIEIDNKKISEFEFVRFREYKK